MLSQILLSISAGLVAVQFTCLIIGIIDTENEGPMYYPLKGFAVWGVIPGYVLLFLSDFVG